MRRTSSWSGMWGRVVLGSRSAGMWPVPTVPLAGGVLCGWVGPCIALPIQPQKGAKGHKKEGRARTWGEISHGKTQPDLNCRLANLRCETPVLLCFAFAQRAFLLLD